MEGCPHGEAHQAGRGERQREDCTPACRGRHTGGTHRRDRRPGAGRLRHARSASGDGHASGGATPRGAILFVADGNVFVWEDGEVEQVTRDGRAAAPGWAPDGQRFAYVQVDQELGYSDLVIAARDGTLLRQVTANRPDAQPGTRAFVRSAYWAMDPAWSPVDDALVFGSDEGGWEPAPDEERLSDPLFLWYAERSDAPPYLLPASARIGLTQESPTFSPDGSKIAFVVRAGNGTQPKTELWTMTLDGGATSVLVSGDGSAFDPTGAPDGKHIAYIQRSGTQDDVWIAPVDGGAPYQLTHVGSCVAPVRSPDGAFLAFSRISGGTFAAAYVRLSPGGRRPAGGVRTPHLVHR
ncbi:MAG: acylaminoacyl-peptidase [Sphaerobacter sp.]|nr:acylaminoacyl-peptidase [Sphaerobacter sp.]